MKNIKIFALGIILAAVSLFAQAATTIHVPDSFLYDAVRGQIVFGTDTIKCGLAPSTYTYNRATHTKRSDVTEVTGATGYTAGGQTATISTTNDTLTHKLSIVITPAVWTGATTITARQVFCYKSRGGAATADELVTVGDFGVDVSSSGGTYTVGAITLEYPGF